MLRGVCCYVGRLVNLEIVSSSANVIFCKVEDGIIGMFYFSLVYGSPYLESWPQVWDYLSLLVSQHPGKHMLIGDFN